MTQDKAILVTGGAGYIGSHVTRQLSEQGHRVIVLDNLSTGRESAIIGATLIKGNTGDQALVSRILIENDIDSVIHFAANIIVPESVEKPLMYYNNNTCNARSLLDCCHQAGVRHFIFSSTAAVYGIPDESVVTEDTPLSPINPYGTSKLMTEWMLRDLTAVSELSSVVLRYFNVAGADPKGRIGQSTPNATHLIKVACQAALGQRDHVAIFGCDYPTKDGTGIRDYIHIEDLADAHIRALSYLRQGGDSITMNCGYGHGYSVREVLNAVKKVSGVDITIVEEPRRAGDPPALVADNQRIKTILQWQPRYDDLETIVRDALNWEKTTL